ALHGDFGHSFIFKFPVSRLIAGRVGYTIALAAVSVIISYLIAIPFGLIGGRYQNSWFDIMMVIYNFFSFAVPLFIF
ncbi:ABC transporter permease, partial [Enterococcus faecalis]